MKYQQDRLFDPAAFDRPIHPGEKSLDDWLATEKVAYHGTFRPHENTQAPTIHLGSEAAATKRLNGVRDQMHGSQTFRDHYYDPSSPDDGYEDWGDNEEPDTHVGQLKAYRMEGAVHETQPTLERRTKLDGNPGMQSYMNQRGHNTLASADANANAADMHYWARKGYESWEIPRSIQQSARMNDGRYIGPDVDKYATGSTGSSRMTAGGAAAARALDRGDNIAYENTIEGEGEHSFVAPTSNLRTWEDDVMDAPHASPMSKQFAMQRAARGQAGSVSFVPDEDEVPSSYGTQLSLLHSSEGGYSQYLPVVRSRQSEFRFTTERE